MKYADAAPNGDASGSLLAIAEWIEIKDKDGKYILQPSLLAIAEWIEIEYC